MMNLTKFPSFLVLIMITSSVFSEEIFLDCFVDFETHKIDIDLDNRLGKWAPYYSSIIFTENANDPQYRLSINQNWILFGKTPSDYIEINLSALTAKAIISIGMGSEDLSGDMDSEDLSGGIAGEDLSGGIAGEDLSGGMAGEDLSGGMAGEDLSGGMAGEDLSGGMAGEDLSGGIASEDLSGGMAGEDLSGGMAGEDLSGGMQDGYCIKINGRSNNS
jgi:hypothetical protein